ncbi:hypothetical protein L209DRAFT_128473 [Thermothelomyces heterothallicus CBS 203.75]
MGLAWTVLGRDCLTAQRDTQYLGGVFFQEHLCIGKAVAGNRLPWTSCKYPAQVTLRNSRRVPAAVNNESHYQLGYPEQSCLVRWTISVSEVRNNLGLTWRLSQVLDNLSLVSCLHLPYWQMMCAEDRILLGTHFAHDAFPLRCAFILVPMTSFQHTQAPNANRHERLLIHSCRNGGYQFVHVIYLTHG